MDRRCTSQAAAAAAARHIRGAVREIARARRALQGADPQFSKRHFDAGEIARGLLALSELIGLDLVELEASQSGDGLIARRMAAGVVH